MKPRPRTLSWPYLLLVCILIAVSAAVLILRFKPGLVLDADGGGSPTFSKIEDGLYMGGRILEPPPGATAVLNLCEREDAYTLPVSSWQPIPDAAAPPLEWLEKQAAFVAEQRAAGRTVYVHCQQGVSRAGMVVTAYYMREKRWTRDEALAFVRSKREIVNPNPSFMKLLLDYERSLNLPS